MTIIRLPKLVSNKYSPCDMMYRYVCKRMGADWEVFRKKYSVSDFYVCQDTFNILEKMEYKWAVKHNDKKYMGKGWFLSAWEFYWCLDVSPVVDNSVPRGRVRLGKREAI